MAENKNKVSSEIGQGYVILFGLPFFLAGCFLLWTMVIGPILKMSQSSDWIKTPCLITKSELHINNDSDGNTYSPKIHYTYQYNGKQYKGETVDFSGEGSSSDKVGESEPLKAFPVNQSRFCYVNPDIPSEAVLIKDWGRGLFKWVAIPFGGVFAFIGLGLILAGVSPWIFKKKKKNYKNQNEVTLTPTAERLTGLAAALFITVFWNGIVSVFLVIWLGGLIRGTATGFMEVWGLGLFLSPFICIGAGFLWKLYKEVRKFFAPKVSLTLKNGDLWKCGDHIDLQWNLPLSAQVDKITLDFVCKELATYSQGSSSSTDEEIVAEYSIYEKNTINFTGSCKFTVPENLMPSFDCLNNTIQWGIRVQTQGSSINADDFYNIELIEKYL